jgi:hypothetical protein
MGGDNELFNNKTVSEYILQIKHPVTNQPMFDFVYSMINGKREFVISRINSGDAESYITVIQGDIAQKMDPTGYQYEFCGVADVL